VTQEIGVGLAVADLVDGGIIARLGPCLLPRDVTSEQKSRCMTSIVSKRGTMSASRLAMNRACSASIPRALGDHGVSIAVVTQKECDADVRAAELVITMHGAREGAMREARLVMERLSPVTRADSFRRAEGLANGR